VAHIQFYPGVQENKYDEMGETCRKKGRKGKKKMVKVSLYLIKQHAVKTNGEVDVQLHHS
jgi:hypothetical protein